MILLDSLQTWYPRVWWTGFDSLWCPSSLQSPRKGWFFIVQTWFNSMLSNVCFDFWQSHFRLNCSLWFDALSLFAGLIEVRRIKDTTRWWSQLLLLIHQIPEWVPAKMNRYQQRNPDRSRMQLENTHHQNHRSLISISRRNASVSWPRISPR